MGVVSEGESAKRLAVTIGPDELLALEELSRAGAAELDPVAIAADALREGLAARLSAAGLAWPAPAESGEPEEVEELEPDVEPAGRRRAAVELVAGSFGVFLLVALVGGYGYRWSWTGFAGNKQVWDWLQLLLLPIAFGTFPLWLKYGGFMSRARKLALGAAVAAFGAFIALGYLVPLGWTGFQGNTLWDWLTLLVLPLVLMTVRIWPSTARELRAHHIGLGAALGIAWVVTLIGGYAASWAWTGYPGNTLWDWLTLLLGPVAIATIVIPAAIRWVSGDVAHVAEEARAREADAPGSQPQRAT